MTTTTYDIFELSKDLKKAGVSEAEIEAWIKFEKAKDEIILENLATKIDLKLEISSVRKDLAIVKRDIILALVVLIPTIMKILEYLKI